MPPKTDAEQPSEEPPEPRLGLLILFVLGWIVGMLLGG